MFYKLGDGHDNKFYIDGKGKFDFYDIYTFKNTNLCFLFR